MNGNQNKRHQKDMATIMADFGQQYCARFNPCLQQRKALHAITSCRTAALGGHLSCCTHCGHQSQAYNSCRNKHCPKCQFLKQERWVDNLKGRILPVKHFHFVFTIPKTLHSLFYMNQAACYTILFKAAWTAIRKSTKASENEKTDTGAMALLHTWTQTLNYHPHIHMIVPAGGISQDRMEWVCSRTNFFAPKKVIGLIFRGSVCEQLKKGIDTDQITLPDQQSWETLKKKLYARAWITYAQKPLKGVGSVINYLGRYTHRVAISNSRITEINQNRVSFRYKDNNRNGITKTMTLDAVEFIRRFMLHVLPNNFYKIRYFGVMASVNANNVKQQCLSLIGLMTNPPEFEGMPFTEIYRLITGKDPSICQQCRTGRMVRVGIFPAPYS